MTKRKPLIEFIQRTLLDRGQSQAGLARELGVSRSTVHAWIAGKREAPERFRSSLQAAARGHLIPTPPPRTTKSGKPARTAGSARITPLPNGAEHVQSHARSAFARELKRVSEAGNAPVSFTVLLHGFRAEDSPLSAPKRSRRIEIGSLSDAEVRALASGRKGALEGAITRAVSVRNYGGGFTFDRATQFSFDSTPHQEGRTR